MLTAIVTKTENIIDFHNLNYIYTRFLHTAYPKILIQFKAWNYGTPSNYIFGNSLRKQQWR